MRAAKAEAGSIEETFIETFQQPVRLFLRDRSIRNTRFDANTHLFGMGSTDCIAHLLDVHAGSSGEIIQRLAFFQRG